MPKRNPSPNPTPPQPPALPPAPAAAAAPQHRGTTLLLPFALAIGLCLGWFAARHTTTHPGTQAIAVSSARLLKPGPWGQIELTPITIAPPEEILPIRWYEDCGTHWFFGETTRENVSNILVGLQIPSPLCQQLLSSAVLRVLTNGLDIGPTTEQVFALPPECRLNLYHFLKGIGSFEPPSFSVLAATFDQRMRDAGLEPGTISRLRQIATPRGEYLYILDLPALLTTIPNYEEKARLVKALTRKDTMLLRLRVTPQSDVSSLAAYWGKACWNTDVRDILQSLKNVPGGATIDVIELLPPLPTSLLYTYPIPQKAPDGTYVNRDCHWTAFNFFREPPDPQYGDSAYATRHLDSDFFPVTSDPRYGDLVLVGLGDHDAIHSAVYIADDIIYTKNGKSPLTPWMFSTISNLVAEYSFMTEPSQQVKISYFRNKYY